MDITKDTAQCIHQLAKSLWHARHILTLSGTCDESGFGDGNAVLVRFMTIYNAYVSSYDICFLMSKSFLLGVTSLSLSLSGVERISLRVAQLYGVALFRDRTCFDVCRHAVRRNTLCKLESTIVQTCGALRLTFCRSRSK